MIEKLPYLIFDNKCTFRRVKELETCYVYEIRVECTNHLVGYELFAKKVVSGKEAHPKDSDFGSWAFNFNTGKEAISFGRIRDKNILNKTKDSRKKNHFAHYQ